jgi:VanZ family protein
MAEQRTFMIKPIFTLSGSIIVIFLLFIHLPEKSPLINALENSAHVPLFSFIAWILITFFSRLFKNSHLLYIAATSFTIAVVIGISTELLQGMVGNGRSPEIKDVINDAIGAYIVTAYWISTKKNWIRQEHRWNKALWFSTFFLLIIPATPIAEECILLVQRDRIFPVICSFEKLFEKQFIKGVWSTVLHRAPAPVEWQENHSNYAGRVVVKTSEIYTGIALSNIHPNWTGYNALTFKVFTLKRPFSTMTVWILDGKLHKKFKDRLKFDYTLKRGENFIRISLPTTDSVSLKAPVALNDIKGFGMYFNDITDTFTVWVDDFRLEQTVK